ncbi:hypothetical protein [Paenibacillus lemnae]|uniref:Uncharacterized protein n=1 Tax=Paenibacillus lemnae TaxID=1330551 RepID=A0A848M934_PAELE|nr:hypothetical protein [Paenibacillus lemnae]NMO96592.1 hypothetical protein [Paenibacillus lemnae]
MVVLISGAVFTLLMLVVILFQCALALGKPWGEYAMGGKFPGKFPPAMRAACLFQIVILAGIAAIVMSESGFILSRGSAFSDKGIWFVVAFSTLAVILNLITRSSKERKIWAPVSIVLFATSLVVALS